MSTESKPYRVLIADDHAPTRDDVRRALDCDERFKICAEATDAVGAVQRAVRYRPDICLLDVRMPGGGLSAAWEIAARLPRARVVMLTVSGEDCDLFTALRAGAAGYLLKTMNFARLPDALAGVSSGEAAISPSMVARVVNRFRVREPRWRQPLDSGSTERLTSREWEVLELLTLGQSTIQIAGGLVISASAVRAHITAIVRKLRVRDRAAAIELFHGA
jgi:DNA-binding NarL/FixJ family response regulator